MSDHYLEKLVQMLATYLAAPPRKASFLELGAALGCTGQELVGHIVVLVETEQPAQEHEQLVVQTLIAAMHRNVKMDNSLADCGALMNGLLRNERWRACLLTEEAAVDFAILSLTFTHWKNSGPLYTSTAPSFCSAMRQWLCRSDPFNSIPDVSTLAQELFGIAWVDLALPSYNAKTGMGWHAHVAAQALRPTLMPGLCQASEIIYDADLPALD